ncbi:hypothetical protein ACFL59_05260, partial [Planctomycetota bacterium]
KRVAVAMTADNTSYRKTKSPIRGGWVDLGGKPTMAPGQGTCAGEAFAGDVLYYLDMPDVNPRGEGGYRLMAWGAEDPETAVTGDTGRAVGVTVSPDGGKLAFLEVRARRAVRIRVLYVKTRTVTDSEEFRSDDVTFDGLPMIHWDAKGEGIYYHACPRRGKKPWKLMRFDVASETSAPVVEQDNVGVFAVLDEDYLAVVFAPQDGGRHGCGVLRLSDGMIFPLPEGTFVMGGRGRRLVVFDRSTRTTSVYEFTLPAE